MFKITAVQNRSNDWKTVSLVTPDGDALDDVSVNRQNKRGEIFPNFDGIIPGADIAGTIWTNPTGKNYLFAPKAPKSYGNRNFGAPKPVQAPSTTSYEQGEIILNRLTDIKFSQVNIESKIDQIQKYLQIKQGNTSKVANTDMDYPANDFPTDSPF